MSARRSLILTDRNEHWYEDVNDGNIEIEIDKSSVDSIDVFDSDRDTLMVSVSGDSQLGRILKHYLADVDEGKFKDH